MTEPVSLADWASAKRWFPGRLKGLEPQPHVLSEGPGWWLVALDYGGVTLQVPLVEGAEATFAGHGVSDGCASPVFLRGWLARMAKAGGLSPTDPTLADQLYTDWLDGIQRASALGGEQSNTSVLIPARRWPAVVKFFRVLSPGSQPEVALPLALSKAGFVGVPHVRALSQVVRRGEVYTSSVATALVPDAKDGFQMFTEAARVGADLSEAACALGASTGQMHQLLAEAFGEATQQIDLPARLRSSYASAARALPELANLDELLAEFAPLVAKVQRVHGDFHLGQTLYNQQGFSIIDFEGEPLRPLSQRNLPDMPERDVAGMLRSFAYAASMASAPSGWLELHRQAFLYGYRSNHSLVREVLRALEIDKALYEVAYEAQHRPSWVHVPLEGLKRLLLR
ncbi:MAG: phosphotransferase [Winkia neuii]|uniref:phosphotransferase n=1 Tax=Winkia neuii TaxID=33007 RepID=UPI002903FE2E|nr:phosphotransferase [Winkia neuii]MDU3135392.1 phosphotransferase [Winkia neuii]